MARTPRTFSRRSRAETKAGEDIGQAKPREDVTKKAKGNKIRRKRSPSLTDPESEPVFGSA